MDISKYKSELYAEWSKAEHLFPKNEHRITNFEKNFCLFVSKTFKIVVFLWKNRRFNRKKSTFFQKKKSTKKHFSENYKEKKPRVWKKSTKKHMCFLKALCTTPASFHHYLG